MTVIVIVPYRNREPQLSRILPHLRKHGADKVVICEQTHDGQPFNRGCVKNLGFLLSGARSKDTVYFHDVDLLPGDAFPGFTAAPDNTILHLYGHVHCLGGIVGMQANVFSAIGGFCNDQWEWGGEDRALQDTALNNNVAINRRRFCKRFSNDAFVRELNGEGRPMPGRLAKVAFLNQINSEVKRVPSHRLYPGLHGDMPMKPTCVGWRTSPQVLHWIVQTKDEQDGVTVSPVSAELRMGSRS